MRLKINDIRTDGGTQPRAQKDMFVIDDYRDAWLAGAPFPPVVVFYDGSDHWLADGFHRIDGAKAAGLDSIPADVKQGTRRAAILYAAGANAEHGLRRTNDDKRRVVMTLLEDEEWSQWSDREIARRCRVDHRFVGKLRANLTGDIPSENNQRTYKTKHGTVATMNTTNIGKSPSAQIAPDVRETIRQTPLIDKPAQIEQVAKLEPEQQRPVVEKIVSGEAKSVTDARRLISRENMLERPALPTDKYRVVYADPPWQYSNAGLDNYGHAERHYPTMSIEELCALDIKGLVEQNAVLFLWVTSPMLEVSFDVIRAWGFKYKTSFVWDKVRANFGYYGQIRHEFLLVCTRGACTPEGEKPKDSVLTIERSTVHSQKPEEIRKMIEAMYPTGKRLELFARDAAQGWEVWGNQV